MTNEQWEKIRNDVSSGKPVTPETPLELDSLEVMTLCTTAEDVANVELSFAEVERLRTYGELEALLKEKSP